MADFCMLIATLLFAWAAYILGNVTAINGVRRDAIRNKVGEYYIDKVTLEKNFRWVTEAIEVTEFIEED